MCILSTLSALNSIENYYDHIEFMKDSMRIGKHLGSFKTAIQIQKKMACNH